MFNQYAILPTHCLEEKSSYYHPENISDIVHLDSSALLVFTDFHIRPPEKTSRHILASAALEKMKFANIKGLIVIDDNDHIQGVVSSIDILGVKKTTAAQNNSVSPAEVTVGMLMTKTSKLVVFDFKDLSNARVGHIARLLHENSLQHLLVFEENAGKEQILRGIFSSSRLSRQLDMEIGRDMGSHSVAEMSQRL